MRHLRYQIIGTVFLSLLLGYCSPSFAGKTLEEKVQELPAAKYCINSNFEIAWQTTLDLLEEMEIPTTLADLENRVITTAFVAADPARLRSISKNAMPFGEGRFTLKLHFEEVTPSFTPLRITLQIRQIKKMGKEKERLLKTRASFERFLAFRISQIAIGKQFPSLYELRLGFSLIPNLKSELYQISNIEQNSPAFEAGFEEGDILISINETPITIRGGLFETLSNIEQEELLTFQVQGKNGDVYDVPLWVVRVGASKKQVGMQLAWDPETSHFYVYEVVANSAADTSGLEPYDVILSESGIPLDSWTNYYRALARSTVSRDIHLEVRRNGEVFALTL